MSPPLPQLGNYIDSCMCHSVNHTVIKNKCMVIEILIGFPTPVDYSIIDSVYKYAVRKFQLGEFLRHTIKYTDK